MHHGIYHFDPGGETVDQKPAGFAFKNGPQAQSWFSIAGIHVHGHRQLSLKTAGELFHLVLGIHPDDEAERPEDLLAERMVGKKLGAGGLEQIG
ncbi:hypothetical protein D9M72_621650 [compost metagenome]